MRGRPLSNVQVSALPYVHEGGCLGPRPRDPWAPAQTDAEGRYRFEVPNAEWKRVTSVQLRFGKTGYVPDSTNGSRDWTQEEVERALETDPHEQIDAA